MKDQSHTTLSKFYLFTVLLLMLVLPVTAIIIEFYFDKNSSSMMNLIGKWFIFWSTGVRLFTAGLKQVINPSFTAESIFHIHNKESFIVVRELGFANICLGSVAILSFFIPSSRIVAAFAGALFFGIAGVNHIIKRPAGSNEWIAMFSDIFISLVLLAYLVSFINKNA